MRLRDWEREREVGDQYQGRNVSQQQDTGYKRVDETERLRERERSRWPISGKKRFPTTRHGLQEGWWDWETERLRERSRWPISGKKRFPTTRHGTTRGLMRLRDWEREREVGDQYQGRNVSQQQDTGYKRVDETERLRERSRWPISGKKRFPTTRHGVQEGWWDWETERERSRWPISGKKRFPTTRHGVQEGWWDWETERERERSRWPISGKKRFPTTRHGLQEGWWDWETEREREK